MLTGRRLFAGDEMSDVFAAVIRQPIDLSALPLETPASVHRLLRRCLERDRAERLGDMGSARLEIKEAASSGDANVSGRLVAGQPQSSSTWRRLSAALALLALSLALG